MSQATTTTTTTASLKALLLFPFQGREWQGRFAVGAALVLAGLVIPILPLLFVAGYSLEIMRRAIRGEELALPPWADWGQLALDGLRVSVVSLACTLPGTVVLYGGLALYLGATLGLPFVMAGDSSSGLGAIYPLFFATSVAVVLIAMLVGTLLLVLGAIPLPVATAHVAARGPLGAAFHVREWWPLLRANKGGYFVAWVMIAGLLSLGYLVFMLVYCTVCLCGFIPLISAPAGFYLVLVSAALFGQAYHESVALVATSGLRDE